MHFLETEINITKLILACCVLSGMGKTIHHNRPSYGLAFILTENGQTYTFSNGMEIRCDYGDCIFLPKASSYQVKMSEEKTHLFSPRKNVTYCINFLTDGSPDTPFKIHIKNINEFINLYLQAEKLWKSKTIAYEELCRSILYKIIANLKMLYSKKYTTSKQKQILEPALSYINKKFNNEKMKISELAKMCNISEVYFMRLFLSEFGISATVYIRNKRLDFAKDLLDSGEYSVTDAAFISGFNDTSYFSREFKKRFGIVPSNAKTV